MRGPPPLRPEGCGAMKTLKTNLAVKLTAFFLAIATGAGGFWASLFILAQWDTLWTAP